jgi:assimilatory nitrate reductase catalytic subunit
VLDELRVATAGAPADYSGITSSRIDREHGVFWPCSSTHAPGTPRLFSDRFHTANGRARFHRVVPFGAAERPDADYPFYLTTGRVLAQYQSGTQTRRVDRLCRAASEPEAEMHPRAAKRSGFTGGAEITIETRRGRATFRLRTSPGVREDTIFVPFHWPDDQSANRVTNPALDPISRMPEFKVCAARVTPPRSRLERRRDTTQLAEDAHERQGRAEGREPGGDAG